VRAMTAVATCHLSGKRENNDCSSLELKRRHPASQSLMTMDSATSGYESYAFTANLPGQCANGRTLTSNSKEIPPHDFPRFPRQLRHSPEMTRVCSPESTRRPGGAGDDNALPTYGLRTKVLRVGWATLTEHKWVSFGEHRGRPPPKALDGGRNTTAISRLPSPADWHLSNVRTFR